MLGAGGLRQLHERRVLQRFRIQCSKHLYLSRRHDDCHNVRTTDYRDNCDD
jgi:hypothetical protein